MGERDYYGSDLAFIHDAGYSDFAYAAAPGLVALLRRAGIVRGTVVELGCGSGAATRALVAAGHDVLAIDASPAMLRLARRNVRAARFVRRVGENWAVISAAREDSGRATVTRAITWFHRRGRDYRRGTRPIA